MSWGDAASWITAVVALAALAGSYWQFILRPSLLPSAEFDVDFAPLLRDDEHLYGELAVTIKNPGSNMLVVESVRYRLRYLAGSPAADDRPRLSEPQFSKVAPPQGEELFVERIPQREPKPTPSSAPSVAGSSLPSPMARSVPISDTTPSNAPSVAGSSAPSLPPSENATVSGPSRPRLWFLLVRERTFIQPGATQYYRKPVTLPSKTQLVDLVAAFDYRFKVSRFRRRVVKLSNTSVAQIDWTKGISNHTVRRTTHVPAVMPP